MRPAEEQLHVADGSVRCATRDRLAATGNGLLERGEGRRYCPRASGGAGIPFDVELTDRMLTALAAGERIGSLTRDDFRIASPGLAKVASGAGWLDNWAGHATAPDLRIDFDDLPIGPSWESITRMPQDVYASAPPQ